jgi:hypothetical protein
LTKGPLTVGFSNGFSVGEKEDWVAGDGSVDVDVEDANEDATTGVDARVLSGVGVLLRPGSSGARIGFPLRIGTVRYSSYRGVSEDINPETCNRSLFFKYRQTQLNTHHTQ